MKLNRKKYLDKVYACWTGKNIGGTMGTPFEGKTEMQNITGYNSPKGEPLPNDDLDLQLIWLCCVEENGIRNTTSEVLGEYWLNFVPAPWNEYGVAKANMQMGIKPPFSGEYNNWRWKNSNGAWIRTEVWACLFPGFPELAVKYAYNDACVDHGLAEGTYAAMFVAALESEAFREKDIRKLIEKGLSFIPGTSRIAKSVELAQKLYDNKVDFTAAREAIVKENEDLGWFQAPSNIGFVILGLLYGEGDFRKTMIHTINCGDDTDCTGATVGSIMGIINGSECIPGEWAEYIGDKIVNIAIDSTYLDRPRTCTELTQRIYELVPSCIKAYELFLEYTDDGDDEYEELPEVNRGWKRVKDFPIPETAYTYNAADLVFAKVQVEFDKPCIKAGESVTLKFKGMNVLSGPREVHIDLMLPEGWSADTTSASIYIPYNSEAEVTITANENVRQINKVYAEFTVSGRMTDVVTPIVIHG